MSNKAEQQVIGALLIDQDVIEKVYGELSAEMFTNEVYGKMFIEFQRAYDNGYKLTPTLLEQKIRCEAIPTSVIMQEIMNCMNDCMTSVNIKSDAQVVIDDYKSEHLNKVLNSIKVSPTQYNEQALDLLEELEVFLGKKKSKSKSLSEIAKEFSSEYFKDIEKKRLYIGFDLLDDLLGGLEGGDMIVIGARPSVGKSALVTQITSNLARNGKKIGFYNLEMQEKQVYERFLASESGIPMSRIRNARSFIGDEELRFAQANDELLKATNIVLTTGGHSVRDIRNESKHMDYDIIIIDYLQLLTADKTYSGNRTAEVGEISRAIKNLAMELNIPIIALSQMNRLSEQKDNKEPTMSELREAGNIEQDASVIMLLWNVDAEDKTKKGCKIEKNRQGKCGKVILYFDGEHMKFSETNEVFEDIKGSKYEDDCPFGN